MFLAKLGHSITAVDSSGVGLAKAKKFAESEGVADHLETIVVDCTANPPLSSPRLTCVEDGLQSQNSRGCQCGHAIRHMQMSDASGCTSYIYLPPLAVNDYDLGTAKWDAIISVFCHLPPPLRVKVGH